MKHLHSINEAKNIDNKILEILKKDENYKDIVKEFNLKPYIVNKDTIALINRNIFLYIDVNKNKINVEIEKKPLHSSSFFMIKDDKPTREEKDFNKKIHMLMIFGELGLMDAVWNFNKDIFMKNIETLPSDKILKLIENTNLSAQDIEKGIYGDARDKYYMLKNLFEFKPQSILNFKYLPKSIDLSPRKRNIIKQGVELGIF